MDWRNNNKVVINDVYPFVFPRKGSMIPVVPDIEDEFDTDDFDDLDDDDDFDYDYDPYC